MIDDRARPKRTKAEFDARKAELLAKYRIAMKLADGVPLSTPQYEHFLATEEMRALLEDEYPPLRA